MLGVLGKLFVANGFKKSKKSSDLVTLQGVKIYHFSSEIIFG